MWLQPRLQQRLLLGVAAPQPHGVPGAGKAIVDLDITEWRKTMTVNLDGTFLALRCALTPGGWPGMALFLIAAGIAHGADLRIRWRNKA